MFLMDFNPIAGEIEPFFNPPTDIFFMLFTRRNPRAGQRINQNDVNAIRNSNFNAAHPTRFLIHGFNSGQDSGMNIAPTATYLQRGEFNVFVVDWSVGASTLNYITARNRVPVVAGAVATFIDLLHQNAFITFNRLNIAGHSLGAHIAGLVGKRVTRGRIQVIYGLDPAGPLFSVNTPAERLAVGDAVYVECIHSNDGTSGIGTPIGNADFYPNWGRSQPGCLTNSCSHSRAHELFAETIISNRFVSRRCLSYAQIGNQQCTGSGTVSMGGDPGNVGNTGVFFVATNSNSPFARG
ncbi:unnamed protein product [Diamesa tonsa]